MAKCALNFHFRIVTRQKEHEQSKFTKPNEVLQTFHDIKKIRRT